MRTSLPVGDPLADALRLGREPGRSSAGAPPSIAVSTAPALVVFRSLVRRAVGHDTISPLSAGMSRWFARASGVRRRDEIDADDLAGAGSRSMPILDLQQVPIVFLVALHGDGRVGASSSPAGSSFVLVGEMLRSAPAREQRLDDLARWPRRSTTSAASGARSSCAAAARARRPTLRRRSPRSRTTRDSAAR